MESSTDVRLVEALAARFPLEVLARRMPGGVEISHPPEPPVRLAVGPSARLAHARWLLRALRPRRGARSVVLVQGYGTSALVANVVMRFTGAPALMLVCSPVEAYYRCRRHHAGGAGPYRRRELWTLALLARLNARLGLGYVVLSRHLADVVRGHGARRVEIVPVFGVNTAVFRAPAEERAALRRRLSLPVDGQLIVFSSRIAPEKDAETLLAALRRLRDRGRDVRVVNRSGGHEAFRAEAERAGVADRVIAGGALHPHRELPLLYGACDVCVQASREEGLGFSPLEALASGVPVVAADVGGLRETIVDGETGWTYPVGDADALADAVEAVLDDPAEGRRRAAAGRRMVEERFAAEAVMARLAALLREAAGT